MDSGGFQPLVCGGGLCVNAYGERRAEEKGKQVKWGVYESVANRYNWGKMVIKWVLMFIIMAQWKHSQRGKIVSSYT